MTSPHSPFAMLSLDRPSVMGVLNVTPDSFSDGGKFQELEVAVEHGRRLARDGAHIIDVGGESTRPGAEPVSVVEELERVIPVVEGLADLGVPLSVDTSKAPVAAAALGAGATWVNDVTAGRHDPDILGVVGAAGAGYVAMHMQGEPRTMQRAPSYGNVVAEVGDFLAERVQRAEDAGIAADRILVDPGIGFGKTLEHNLSLLAGLSELAERVPAPLLVGTSRKSFMGALLDLPVEERDEATLATVVWAFERGASVVRVHDVRSAVHAARLVDVLRRATPEGVEGDVAA